MPDVPFNAEAPQDPSTFLVRVDEAVAAIDARLEEGFDAAANWLAEHATEAGAVAGGLAFGIPGAVAGAALGSNAEDDVREAIEEVRAKWREVQDAIQDQVLSDLGDPVALGVMSADYREAAELLNQVGEEVGLSNSQVAATWSGTGASAYLELSTQQVAAAADIEAVLRDTATTLDRGSDTIVSMWAQQLDNLVQLYTSVAGAVADIADAGNWATLGAGPLVDVLAAGITGIARVFTTFVRGVSTIATIIGGLLDGALSAVPEWPDVDSRTNGPWQVADAA